MTGRRGEKNAVHFRTDRIAYVNGGWYFSIREQAALFGPYSTKADAEQAINVYVRDLLKGIPAERAFSNQLLAEHLTLA